MKFHSFFSENPEVIKMCTNLHLLLYCSRKYPETTHPKEGHWKFRGAESQKPIFLKESMKQNWKFQGVGGGFKPKNLLWGYGYFTEPHMTVLRIELMIYMYHNIYTPDIRKILNTSYDF